MDWRKLKLSEVERECRQAYLRANERGVTHADMAWATGLPESTFSMWLSGYRTVVKVEVLDTLIRHAEQVEKMAGR